MRIRLRRHLPALAVFAAACASAGESEPRTPGPERDWRSLVGCYREGDWVFALDSVPFVGIFSHEERARIARSSHAWDSRYETYWRAISPDSVKLVLNDGLHGRVHRLVARGDTLVGRSYLRTDIVLPRAPKPERVRAVREPCPPAAAFSRPLPDSAAQTVLFGYFAVRPTDAELEADPWRAVAPLRAWLQAHPDAAAEWRMRTSARVLFERAATLDVRANARELVGTYRLEVERTGGPTHVFYGRTEVRPRYALRGDTAAPFIERPPGYHLRFTLALDSASLPRPGPGRRHRNAYGGNDTDNSHIDVRLPAVAAADGTRRFRGSVLLVNFGSAFHGRDPELTTWEHDWFHVHFHDMSIDDVAEIVLWPDGRVTFTQREEAAPGRVVTLRGERISGAAWECSGYDCY